MTIDTGLTAENTSYFPSTADSVAWLAANGGQEALNRAVRGNVDATFQYLAAMDSADAVRAYARFNCTVRYSAASDELHRGGCCTDKIEYPTEGRQRELPAFALGERTL